MEQVRNETTNGLWSHSYEAIFRGKPRDKRETRREERAGGDRVSFRMIKTGSGNSTDSYMLWTELIPHNSTFKIVKMTNLMFCIVQLDRNIEMGYLVHILLIKINNFHWIFNKTMELNSVLRKQKCNYRQQKFCRTLFNSNCFK